MKGVRPQTTQTKTTAAAQKNAAGLKKKDTNVSKNPYMTQGQMLDKQMSNFEQHKAIKILQKETHIQNTELRVFLASYLRRHIDQFRELDGDPMEFLMALTLNLKYVFMPKGKVIFHENKNEDDLYFIIDGEVQFYSRKSETDIQTEKFWQEKVQSKQQHQYSLTNRDHYRLHKDEEVLKFYKCSEDEKLFHHSKKKNMYFQDGVLLFKKTYQRTKGQSFGVDEKDNSQTAVAHTDAILAVTSQCDYVQSYAKYKEKNSFAFDILKKFIAPLVSQYPTRIDDKTLREIACKTTVFQVPLYQTIYSSISEDTLKELPNLNQKSRNELGLNEAIYIVKNGYVEFYQNYESSDKKGIKALQINEGEIFGHECLFKPEKQNYTVISATPFTQLFMLKKEYICENHTLLDILQVRGQQLMKKIQINEYHGRNKVLQAQFSPNLQSTYLNDQGEKYLRISKHSISQNSKSQLRIQSKNDMNSSQVGGGNKQQTQEMQPQPFPQSASNIQLRNQSRSSLNYFIVNPTTTSQNNIAVSGQRNSAVQLLFNSNNNNHNNNINNNNQQQQKSSLQIPSDAPDSKQKNRHSPSLLNVPAPRKRKESIQLFQEEFKGSFDFLDDENPDSHSKMEQDLEKYKQKSRTYLQAAQSCTYIQIDNPNQQSSSPSKPNNNPEVSNNYQLSPNINSAYQNHRKSLSSHATPQPKINFVIKEVSEFNGEEDKQVLKGLPQNEIKNLVEEIRLSPQKLTSIEMNKGAILDLKSYLKSQRNAKLVPQRQPDEFRIKNPMFDSSSQSTTANNGIDSHNEQEVSPTAEQLQMQSMNSNNPFKNLDFYSLSGNQHSKNSYLNKNARMSVPQLNIQQSIYYSCGQIIAVSAKERNKSPNNNNVLFTPQSSRSNEENTKQPDNNNNNNNHNNHNIYKYNAVASPIPSKMEQKVAPQTKSNKPTPFLNSPARQSLDYLNSPLKQNYLNFKIKHYNPLHVQKEKSSNKVQSN